MARILQRQTRLADKSMVHLVVSLVSSGGNPEKNLIQQMPSVVRVDADGHSEKTLILKPYYFSCAREFACMPRNAVVKDETYSMIYLVASLVWRNTCSHPEKKLIHQMPSCVRSDAGCRLNC